jgi:hypothetical protein
MKKKEPNVEGKFPKLPYFYNRFYYIASDILDVNNLISTCTKELFMKKRAQISHNLRELPYFYNRFG